MDADILFADMDFDIIGSRRHGTFTKKTEIRLPYSNVPVVPDGMFGSTANRRPIIYALEIHRTTQTKQVVTQIKRYVEVLESGAVASKYGLETSPLICSVHMKDNVLRGVKSAFMQTQGFKAFKGAFLFNTFDQLNKDISKRWTFADDTGANPFPLR